MHKFEYLNAEDANELVRKNRMYFEYANTLALSKNEIKVIKKITKLIYEKIDSGRNYLWYEGYIANNVRKFFEKLGYNVKEEITRCPKTFIIWTEIRW